jgi:hypothetical protein
MITGSNYINPSSNAVFQKSESIRMSSKEANPRDSKHKAPEDENKVKKSIEVEKHKLKSLVQNLMESFLQGRRDSDITGKDDIVDLHELRKYSRRASISFKKGDIDIKNLFLRKLSESDNPSRNPYRNKTLKELVDEKRSSLGNENVDFKRSMSKFENSNLKRYESDDFEIKKKSMGGLLSKLSSPQHISHTTINVLNNDIFSLDKDQLLQKINEKKLQKNKKTVLKFTRQNLYDDQLSGEFNLEDDSVNKTLKIYVDDNRILKKTKKLDDSMSSQEDEELNNMKESSFYIDLNGIFKSYWDILIILCTLYTIIAAPYMLAFIENDPYYLIIMESVIDIIYIADLAIHFFIPYINNEEEVVMNLKAIAKNYLFGWFIIDLLASIPGSTIVLITNSNNGSNTHYRLSTINKAARVARIYRFLKISKILKAMKVSSGNYTGQGPVSSLQKLSGVEMLSSKNKRLFYFIINFILVSHIISCLWVFIGKNNYPNWIDLAHLNDSNDSDLYLSSLYFHWTTIYTIGYGDIVSNSSYERLYNCVLLFVGVLIYSYTISQLGNILSSKDNITSKHLKNLEVLNGLKMKYSISDGFYNKIYRYLNHNYKFNKNERYGFIKELPPKIRHSLLFDMYRDVINNFAFFSYTDNSDFISKVLFSMKPIRLYRKEYVVVEGQYLEEILFVRKGYLSVHLGVKYNEFKLIDIKRNEHFGDILALSNQRSPVGIKAGSKIVDVLAISKEDFMDISKEFSDAMEDIFLVSSYNFSSLLEIIEVKKVQIKETHKLRESVDYGRKQSCETRKFSHLFKDESLIPFFEVQDSQKAVELKKPESPISMKDLNNNDKELAEQEQYIPRMDIFPGSTVKTFNSEQVFETQKKTEYSFQSIPTTTPPVNTMFNFNLYIQNNSFIQKSSTEQKANDDNFKHFTSKNTFTYDGPDISKQQEKSEDANKDISSFMNVIKNIEINTTPVTSQIPSPKSSDASDSQEEEDKEEQYDNFDAEKTNCDKTYQTKLSKIDLPASRRASAYFSPLKRMDMNHDTYPTTRSPKRFLSIKNPQIMKSSSVLRDMNKQNDTVCSITSSSKSVNAGVSKKLLNVSKEKFRKSSMLVTNITNNLKQSEQVESNPHEFFVNEFKELLYNQIETEVAEQEKKVVSIFMKIYNKKEVLKK